MIGKELQVCLRVRNTGDKPFSFTGALHTYLTVGDVRQVSVHGLEGLVYVDRLTDQRQMHTGPLFFKAETDYIFPNHGGTIEVVDPALSRRIRIEKAGSASTVVWNPWIAKAARMPDFGDEEWPGMLCIEAAKVLEDSATVGPGGEHALAQRLVLV